MDTVEAHEELLRAWDRMKGRILHSIHHREGNSLKAPLMRPVEAVYHPPEATHEPLHWTTAEFRWRPLQDRNGETHGWWVDGYIPDTKVAHGWVL